MSEGTVAYKPEVLAKVVSEYMDKAEVADEALTEEWKVWHEQADQEIEELLEGNSLEELDKIIHRVFTNLQKGSEHDKVTKVQCSFLWWNWEEEHVETTRVEGLTSMALIDAALLELREELPSACSIWYGDNRDSFCDFGHHLPLYSPFAKSETITKYNLVRVGLNEFGLICEVRIHGKISGTLYSPKTGRYYYEGFKHSLGKLARLASLPDSELITLSGDESSRLEYIISVLDKEGYDEHNTDTTSKT